MAILTNTNNGDEQQQELPYSYQPLVDNNINNNNNNNDRDHLLFQENNQINQQLPPPPPQQQQPVQSLYYANPTYQPVPIVPDQQQQQYFNGGVAYQIPQPHILINQVPTNYKRIKMGLDHTDFGSFKGFSSSVTDPNLLNFMSQDDYSNAVERYNKIVLKNNWIIFVPFVLFIMAALVVLTTKVSFFLMFPCLFLLMVVFIGCGATVYRKKKAAIIKVTEELNAIFQQRQIVFSVVFRTPTYRDKNHSRRRKAFIKVYIDYPSPITMPIVVSQYPTTVPIGYPSQVQSNIAPIHFQQSPVFQQQQPPVFQQQPQPVFQQQQPPVFQQQQPQPVFHQQ